MGKGSLYSLLLHLALLFFMVVGLPNLFEQHEEPRPVVISLEPLPISEITNVRPQQQIVSKNKDTPTPPKPSPLPPAPPKFVKSEDSPTPVIEKKDAPKEVKKEELKKEKPELKDEFKEVLKNLEEKARTPEEEEKPEEKKKPVEAAQKAAKSDSYNPEIPMSITEMDNIVSQLNRCWSPPVGSADDYKQLVTVHAEFNPDGSLIDVRLTNESYASARTDRIYSAWAMAAIRAVKRCTPLNNLPSDKYDTWKEMEIVMDPSSLY